MGSELSNISSVNSLILDSMVAAVRANFFVPVIPLMPPILYNLDGAHSRQCLKHPNVVTIAYSNIPRLAGILQSPQHCPGFECLFKCGERGVQNVAIQVRSVKVREGLGEARVDLGSY